MRFGLISILFLFQDGDAELQSRLLPIVDRACDLDAAVRAEAVQDAAKICREQGDALQTQAKQKKPSAMIVLALAGKLEGAALFKVPDKTARRVACDLIAPTKDQVPELLRMVEGKELGPRLAAARALGRIEDPAIRQTVSSALGHGMRRAGNVDLLFTLTSAMWRGGANPGHFLVSDAEPDRAAIAIAALCSVPDLVVTETFAPTLSRLLENERIDRTFRSLLIRSLGRRSPSALCPLLSIRDRKFRAEIVDVLDRTLTNPLVAPALHEAWREAKGKKLDDGKTPPQPLSGWIEGWLTRLCGEDVTPENFPAWVRASYRSQVDKQADAAILRGVAGLRKAFDKDLGKVNMGGAVAVAAFTAYALLKCDVVPHDPAVVRALDVLLERDPEGVYSASLAALALGAAVEKIAPRREKLERRLRRTAEILVDSQLRTGGWSYGARITLDQSLDGWVYDLSNTQFAVLGLRAAANAGANVPRATWERAQALLEKAQWPDGGWSYHGREGQTYDKMTAAGAYAWIICRISLDEKLSPEEAAGTERGRGALMWLARSAELKPLSSPPDYYLLYSLERLCMVSKVERLGTHDWYAEGASLLVRSQTREGGWSGSYSPVVDTCMALLFLRKAFIARPDVATETAPRVSEEQAQAVFDRNCEALFREGVRELRLGREKNSSVILVVVESEAAAKALAEALGKEIDGVPLRFAVE
jgi:hypothetical protein